MTAPNESQIVLVASMRAKDGKQDELRAALQSLLEPTRAESGCVTYNLHQGLEDPSIFVFHEVWASPEALGAHMQTPHLQQAMGSLPTLVDGELSLTQLRRIG